MGDSNQRRCAGGVVDIWEGVEILDECPAPGEDFYGQDAQFGWDTLHDHSERFTRSVPVPEEPIVEDHATGLIWQGCNENNRGDDCEIEVENELLQWKQFLAYCDSLAWAGFHDWRLPDRWELESLVDETEWYWNCDVEAFPDCPSDHDWTVSKSAEDYSEYGSAFVVGLNNGAVSIDEIYDHHLARCVRGVPSPRPQARWERDTSVAHQPVVRDHWTGLIWQGCPKGLYEDDCESGALETDTWKGALDYCAFLASLSWGGQDDWRVPSRHELSTIIDDRFVDPALDPEAFATTYYDSLYGGTTWTSTSVVGLYEDEAPEAQSVSMYYGALVDGGHMPKSTTTVEVRCVAGGQE